MSQGRLKRTVKEGRILKLLNFLFLFRYALKEDLITYSKTFISPTIDVRWFIQDCIKKNLVKEFDISCYGVFVKRKVYYLSREGLLWLNSELPLHRYRFRKENINVLRLMHDRSVMQTYFILMKKFKESKWVSEWILHLSQSNGSRRPDGILVLDSGTAIAVEVEKSDKTIKEWKKIVVKLKTNILIDEDFNSVLIVALNESIYKKVLRRVFSMKPGFSDRYLYLSTIDMLKKSCLVRNGEQVSINEMVKQIEEGY